MLHSRRRAAAAIVAMLLACACSVSTAATPDSLTAWKHSGPLYIFTGPEGVALPAAVRETNFPLLLRFDRETFNFSEAQKHGEDIRFTDAGGGALAYQIEQWDADKGAACIWIRIPTIVGNARQAITMYWGNANARSESSGPAVFNSDNGYACVMHMNEPLVDEVGSITPVDAGTTIVRSMIGDGRRFAAGKGIKCGTQLTSLPKGAGPHSTEAWFRARQPNATLIGWGNEGGRGGKVRMQLRSPAHIHIDSDFSDVNSDRTLPLGEWMHVAHTYEHGDGRVYINGRLEGEEHPLLDIKSPERMWIGGWYDNFDFEGDIDEVRISKVARSPNWIKLEYENQKANQTLVGTLPKPGTEFSVSQEKIDILEGQSATVTAQAGGALKVYWIVNDLGSERLVATDRFSYTIDAGRVKEEKAFALRFEAVYPSEVKQKEIVVTIKKMIPDPKFILQASAVWDGRESMEVAPRISNQAEMDAKGVGKLNYSWTVSDGAVIKEIVPGKLILKRSQFTGRINVKLTLNNGGIDVTDDATIKVTEPDHDPWVQRKPAEGEQPEEGQFYARDDKNEGTLYYSGTLDRAADSVFLNLYADGKSISKQTQKLAADKFYAFTARLKPGLIKYKVEFGTETGGKEIVVRTVSNLMCGDAYIIQGQSNAEATGPNNGPAIDPPTPMNDWIRSYGNSSEGTTRGGWGNAIRARIWGQPDYGFCQIGAWGMVLAEDLVERQKIPICILNGAVGGTRIDQHQPNPADHADPQTIYGRLFARVKAARLTHGIRGILWHQGENNQGSASPTGDYDWKSYQQYFVDLSAAWKQDYPNVQHYYVYQVWPSGCNMGATHAGDMLLDVQRSLPFLYSNMRIMSTLGVVSPATGRGLCHFDLQGYAQVAKLMEPLVEQDAYGLAPAQAMGAPDLHRAEFTNSVHDEIALDFGHPMVWKDAVKVSFYLDDARAPIASGRVSGNIVYLKLTAPTAAKTIGYIKGRDWDGTPKNLLYGVNGVAALTCCDVPIADHRED